jgi:hypothetical protein
LNVDATAQADGGRDAGGLQTISKGINALVGRAAVGAIGGGVEGNQVDVTA